MKKIIGMLAVCLLLAGCGTESDEQVRDNVIAELDNEEYEKALTLLEGNVGDSQVDEKTKSLHATILAFNDVQDARNNADWDGVLVKAHTLLEKESLENSLKVKLEKMILEAEMEINNSIRENFEQNSAIADEEGNPPPLSTVKDEDTPKPSKQSSVSLKEKYLAKLADIENGIKEFEQTFNQGTQVEITQAQAEVFTRWDKILNEIYEELKKQLSPNDMSKLREEQRDWLKYRDEKAAEAALVYKGGTMETLEYVSTQARLTKERSYELVDLYMK